MNDEHSTMSGLVDRIEFNCGGIDGMHCSSVRYTLVHYLSELGSGCLFRSSDLIRDRAISIPPTFPPTQLLGLTLHP